MLCVGCLEKPAGRKLRPRRFSSLHYCFAALLAYYGTDAIFIDIDSIPLGIDFRQQIQEAITKNDLVLAPQGSA
jgi:hypothetical protein